MGYAPEGTSCAEYYRRVAQPVSPARSIGIVGTTKNNPTAGSYAIIAVHFQASTLIMKTARIFQQDRFAGVLEARDDGSYRFTYEADFRGEPVSLTMPTTQLVWDFPRFPAPFEGLLPEGVQLDALLRIRKLDRDNFFGQLLAVGNDVVGSLRIEEGK